MDRNALQEKHRAALDGLAANTRSVYGFEAPVLVEGGSYRGIWLECGPLEGLVYGRYAPDVARANHEVFFHHQRADGYLPFMISGDKVGTESIQMVVPIAATALETADLTRDEAFLARAYTACARWDDWLAAHRNTRGTGLCEMFCQFDTGHDGSPRLAGLPPGCPEGDAAMCPVSATMPYLAPDLSATVYGGRVALAAMADRLGRSHEAAMWQERADAIRRLILEICYDPEDAFFYDVDAQGNFVKIRSDLITRVFGEHVVDQALFDRIYARHIRRPESFWTPYPLPSIAADDPAFEQKLPRNSWGGASQALTALRAPRWFTHYGRADDLRHLMGRWVEAIVRAPDFMQQMNPWTGAFSTSAGYSPAMCVLIDFVTRLRLLDTDTREGEGRATP